MGLRAVSADLVVAAGGQTLSAVQTTPTGKTRRLKKAYFEQNADQEFVIFVEQDNIMVAWTECEQFDSEPLELDHVVGPGESFQFGFNDTAAAGFTTGATVVFEETMAGGG